MQAIMPFIWIFVAIAAVIFEVLTARTVSLSVVPAAIVTAILAFFRVAIYWQIITFVLVSAVCLVLLMTVFSRYFKRGDGHTDLELIIGERGIVTERIDNDAGLGQLKVKGLYWAARTVDGNSYEVGDVLTVVAIEGVKLICRK